MRKLRYGCTRTCRQLLPREREVRLPVEREEPPDERAGARDVLPDERDTVPPLLRPVEREGARDVLPDERLPDERDTVPPLLRPVEREGARDVLPDERLPDERDTVPPLLRPVEREGARDVRPDERLPDERDTVPPLLRPVEREVPRVVWVVRLVERVAVDVRPVVRPVTLEAPCTVLDVVVLRSVPTLRVAVLRLEVLATSPPLVVSAERTPFRPTCRRSVSESICSPRATPRPRVLPPLRVRPHPPPVNGLPRPIVEPRGP